MPAFLEKKLKAEAVKKGKTGKAADAYVYGTMNNIGAMHGNKITAKGERMQEKHDSESHSYDFRKQRGRRAAPRMKNA